MNKKLIRLTEGDLHKIVKESVNKILSEIGDTSRGCKMLGRAYHKANKTNDIVRGQKFGNYLRDKYGYTPHEFFDGIDDAEKEEKTAERRNRMMQKYNRFKDGSNNPYSDEGRYYRHLETEPQGIGESKYYNPRTYERDESKEFTHDEIKKLVSILKENPIEEMWKPYDLGWCKVQRVEANQTSGRSYLMSDPHNMTAPQDMYSDGNNGTIYLQIGRMPNTHWLDESGYTYMCWKW